MPDQIARWVAVAALSLIAFHLVLIAFQALRRLRQGQDRVLVGVTATTDLIGLGCALACSWAGGLLTFRVLTALRPSDLGMVLTQAAAALAFAWLGAAAFDRWLVGPILAWFIREGEVRNG